MLMTLDYDLITEISNKQKLIFYISTLLFNKICRWQRVRIEFVHLLVHPFKGSELQGNVVIVSTSLFCRYPKCARD